MISQLKKFWSFLKKDTWQSWLVSLILAFIIIKFIFFPLLSLATASPLPLVVVESCSMYHSSSFDGWWESNKEWYEKNNIYKPKFLKFPFKNGLNKGDIILVANRGANEVGDVIIFNSDFKYPLIHRLIDTSPLGTKGDNNFDQLPQEKEIPEDQVIGKAIIRIPALGWIKLIFFEGLKSEEQRGFC